MFIFIHKNWKKKNQQQKIFQKYFSSKLAYSLLF